ncbi:BMP family lipoprotein [Actinomyces vulturis]|uniref:BMP family lipoprotein n=1 Tax=Actinomyces vulturis TaxID=1857645 RepID=UPI001FDFE7A5|nr:BMP family ABC transporter substrate-binding protein [Actinomyces vulturis]
MTLAACGAAPGDDSSKSASTSGASSNFKACMVSDEGGFDDQSFNQSGKDGMERAASELGVQVNYAESKSDGDYQTNVDAMVQDGCNLIIGVGFKLANVLTVAAQANPDVEFALVDSVFTNADGAPITVDNGRPLIFNTAEAAYLAGYLAAGMSSTGKVATYGGMEIPTVQIFMEGYAKGVEKYNEDNGTSVQVLGWSAKDHTGSFVGDFSSTDKGQAITEGFISQGADVIMPVAGPVGAGTLSAVKAASNADALKVIWVDQDGYVSTGDSHILSSVVKEIGNSVFDTVKDASEGKFTSEPYIGTLANDGVALAPFHDYETQVPAELKEKITELQKQIADGSLDVHTEYDPTK